MVEVCELIGWWESGRVVVLGLSLWVVNFGYGYCVCVA